MVRGQIPRLRSAWAAFVAITMLATACGNAAQDRLGSAAATCLGSTGPGALSTLFEQEPGGLISADYQRAVALPDGRTLWFFQDATIRLPPPLTPLPTTTPPVPPLPVPTTRLLHNVGMIQSGACFEVLRSGTAEDPKAWLLPTQTTPFVHWFWPLGAQLGADGVMYVHLAEMVERGPLYLSATDPVGTRIVGIDPSSLQVTFTGTPPGSSTSLYGFSVTSDDSWTYLYGQCHRQFGWDVGPFGVGAHDLSCAGNVPVARVPRGHLFDPLRYWDGSTWQADPRRAIAVMPVAGRGINPAQVRYVDGQFLAVTKVGDWFGSVIQLDSSPTAHGPWTNYARLPAVPRCDSSVCNTYFASWVPGGADGRIDGDFVVGLSHNRWDGRNSVINRPTFLVAPPPGSYGIALRCSLGVC